MRATARRRADRDRWHVAPPGAPARAARCRQLPRTPHGPSDRRTTEEDRIVWRHRDRLVQQLERAEQAVAARPLLADFLPRAQVQLDRERIRRCTALVRLRLFGHRSGDRARELVDDDEQIGHRPIETRRPHLKPVGDADQPNRDPVRRSCTSQGTFDDHVDAELCSDLARVAVGALEAHHDAARAQSQAARHRQRVDQLLGESVGEIVVVHGATVAKRQYCESLGPAPNAHIGARNHVCGTT